MRQYERFINLIGKVMLSVERANDTLIFTTNTGEMYKFYHKQDCCEHVGIAGVIGDLQDLVGSPILMAESVIYSRESDLSATDKDICRELLVKNETEVQGQVTWTFHTFATEKGYIDIRWYGICGDCCTSENVDFYKVLHQLQGKKVAKVELDEGLTITTKDGEVYKIFHPQYTPVFVSPAGDLSIMVGATIVVAEEFMHILANPYFKIDSAAAAKYIEVQHSFCLKTKAATEHCDTDILIVWHCKDPKADRPYFKKLA
jgi:hypothetical protein